jgi:integrase
MDAQLFKGFNNGKVNRLLKIIAQRAKVIRGLYFKASRDTFGTTLYLLSGDQKLVQKQLQHSKREQTDKYVHISEQIENEGLKRVFNGNQKG